MFGCRSKSLHFCVSSKIIQPLRQVVSAGYHRPFTNNDRTHRNFIEFESFMGFGKRKFHKVFVRLYRKHRSRVGKVKITNFAGLTAQAFTMYRTHHCGELRISDEGKIVTLAGWVQRSRDLGGMTFIDLRDRYGITQLVFNMEENADLCLQARKLGREFVVQVTGKVIERSSKNAKMATGDVEVV